MGDDVLNNVPNLRSFGSSRSGQYDLQLGSGLGVYEAKPFVENWPPGLALNDNASLSPCTLYGFNSVPQMPKDYAKDFWVCDRGQGEMFLNVLSSEIAVNVVKPELALG